MNPFDDLPTYEDVTDIANPLSEFLEEAESKSVLYGITLPLWLDDARETLKQLRLVQAGYVSDWEMVEDLMNEPDYSEAWVPTDWGVEDAE